ncbi:Hint domain-containing protein [Acidisoma silvae]|uniref:Hint domain-containing protein n=1 Tax=Acidisoma silvae TaxID=2802396 RepID=A0A963YPB8_9PROT|nr:Hint domain-containing protein [Acidisoma silvae]MCB8874312.1 Hint domain-containing protein [Acidisoma silvae]
MSQSLAAFAEAVQSLIKNDGTTAYTYETVPHGATDQPDVSLTAAEPYVFTDCSSWVNYALDSVAPIHQAVVAAEREDPRFNIGTVTAYGSVSVDINEAAEPWARADVLSYFFGNVADGTDGFTGVSNFADLQAGDIIAYSLGIYTDPSAPDAATDPALQSTSDTGHTAIVIGDPVAVPEDDWAGTGLSPDVVAVYAVPVIDSSTVAHFTNLSDFTEPVADSRTYQAQTPPLQPGGLGTGTIWFGVNAAGQAIQFRFDEGDPWFPNTDSLSGEAAVSIAAARLTSTIDLSGSMLNADNQLVVDAFANNAAVLNGTAYNTEAEQITGAGGLLIEGAGYLQLQAGNSFTGGITLDGAILNLGGTDAAGTGTIAFAAGAQSTLQFDIAATPANAITGFAPGDTLDILGLSFGDAGSVSYQDGVLTVSDGSQSTSLTLQTADGLSDFVLASDGNGGTDVTVACFVAGTRIMTPDGERAVEDLATGDSVLTADGDAMPVIWIGQRRVDCARHPRPETVWPVRVEAHAFGQGLPARDLYLSPDHALFHGGVLIPVKHLLNGDTVRQERRPAVTYFHVELPRHAVILAERLPAESYLDTDDRAAFDGAVTSLHAAWGNDARPDAVWVREALGCAPLCVTGPEVESARRLLSRRSSQAALPARPALRRRA